MLLDGGGHGEEEGADWEDDDGVARMDEDVVGSPEESDDTTLDSTMDRPIDDRLNVDCEGG
jgi:hypothetical protein